MIYSIFLSRFRFTKPHMKTVILPYRGSPPYRPDDMPTFWQKFSKISKTDDMPVPYRKHIFSYENTNFSACGGPKSCFYVSLCLRMFLSSPTRIFCVETFKKCSELTNIVPSLMKIRASKRFICRFVLQNFRKFRRADDMPSGRYGGEPLYD